MITVLRCVVGQHDPWLVGLAVAICCAGSFVSMSLVARASKEAKALQAAWIALAAIVVGTTAWATHFVALLGYLSGARVAYDPALTVASLMLAIAGATVGTSLAAWKERGALPAAGGALLGLSLAGMHYLGMLAYQLDGSVQWRWPAVFDSVLLAAGLSALAMAAARGRMGGRFSPLLAPALLAGSIASLHFTGMSALHVTPLSTAPPPGAQIDVALALSTALAASMIIVVGVLNHAIDKRTRDHADEKLIQFARTDPLTGLPNRKAAVEELAARVAALKPGGRFAALAIEIVNIDAINQQFGSSLADRVIQATAARLIESRKPGVFLARMSGSQFCGVGAVEDREDSRHRAQRVHAALSHDLLIEAHEIQVDIRIGVVTCPDDGGHAEALMRKGQVALAHAIADPLEPVAVYDEQLDAHAQRRLALANDLRGALDRQEFELFYQPQVWIEGRRTIGCEALIRWRHPQLGMISPAEFIPLAEKTGLILPIGEWVLRTACRDAATWPRDVRVAVNLSPLQLRQTTLPQCVEEALRLSGLEPHRLELELTESLLVDDRRRASEIFNNIKALNVRLVLDDFGTGYSSMEVLRQFPFDKIKLDRSFVGELETNDQARAILQAMLTLGHALSTPILVEGVETERQLSIVRKCGCNKVQGYLTGRPAPSAALDWNAPERRSA